MLRFGGARAAATPIKINDGAPGRSNMSRKLKIWLSAVGVAALFAAPATAKLRTQHHAYPRPAYYRPAPPSSPRGGEDLIIRAPNGRIVGTDPDANIRGYMRRDGGGPNSGFGNTGP
jgi:hypothetical protein